MTEIYRKRGRVALYEHGQLVISAEAGEAIDDGGTFIARPLGESVSLPELDPSPVEAAAHEIERSMPHGVVIERLILSLGLAEHEFGDRTWREESRRIHLSITAGETRALIDRGDFDLAEIGHVGRALARLSGEKDAPSRVRLAPAVTAALIPAIRGIAPPNVEVWQEGGGIDGKGNPILQQRVLDPPWPNWYRPSYRSRPVRLPLNIRLRCEVGVLDAGLPRAIALLSPVSGLVIRALVEDGDDVYASTIRVSRIDAVTPWAVWHPYGAGAWGSEVML